jgi:WD40 repeat protein
LTGHTERLCSLAFSPDGQYLASSADDGQVILWDVPLRKRIRTWRAENAIVRSATFSPNSRMLLTATDEYAPRIWDVATGRLLLEVGGESPRSARGSLTSWSPAVFSPDGSYLSAGSNRAVAILDGRPLPD